MSGRSRAWSGLLSGAALAALAAAPAGADLLVLRSGARLETRGAWSERGALVVFHDSRGVLRSLRASEVDLAASRRATAEAAAPKAAAAEPAKPAPAAREPVLRLTEKELPPVADPDAHVVAELDAPREVVLYSAEWCSICHETRAFFAEQGIAYTLRDVDRNPAARAARDQLSGGRQVVPVIDWGGTVLTGFRPGEFLELAREDRQAEARRAAGLRAAASAGEP